MTMLSGAGHDSMNMASLYHDSDDFYPSVVGLVIADEFTSLVDIAIAADILAETLGVLANQ